MGRFERDWFIGWTAAVIVSVSLISAIYFGVQSSNEKYYSSMDKCTAAGGTFIPTGGRSGAICLMGMKQ